MEIDSGSSTEDDVESSEYSPEVSSAKMVDSRMCLDGGGQKKKGICYTRRGRGARVESSKRIRVNGGDGDADTDSVIDYHLDDLRNRRSRQLKRLFNSLTQEQREDVKSIGFGGLLHFNCDLLPDQMNAWLLNPRQFNPVTKYFSVGGKIKFSLTALEAERVFGLNSRGVAVGCGGLYEAPIRALLKEWKRRYKIWFGSEIDLVMMESLIRRLGSGGDDFKRFFVLYVMKTLLTPDSGVDIHLGLVRSLVDVESIKHMNWADYVVDYLCHSIYYYHRRPSGRGAEGCVLLLQLTYFHNTIWPGMPLSSEEPFIKHWGGTKIGERVMEEVRAGGFGQLLFVKKNLSELHLAQAKYDSLGMTSGSQIGSREPLTVWSDAQLCDAIPEVNSRKCWQLIRDVDKVIRKHGESVDVETQVLRDSCFTQLSSNTVQFDARAGFDMAMNNLFSVSAWLEPEMRLRSQHVLSDSNAVVEPPGEGAMPCDLRLSPWIKWVFNYPPTYASALLMKCTTFCNNFPQYKIEFADYCVSDGERSDPIFHDGNNIWLSRADFMTLDHNVPVSASVVNAFSLVLNHDWLKRGMTGRVCFGIVSLKNDPVTHKVLVDEWKKWLKLSHIKLDGAALVYIPVLCQDNYFLVVVNFMDNKIQCIESERHEEGDGPCDRRGRVIGSSFWHLLEVLGDERIGEYHKFSYEHITPHWSTQGKDPDRAIRVMHMMETFNGSAYALHRLRLNEEHKKLQLRVAYACFIGLSTMNQRRINVLEECAKFIEEKGDCFRAMA